MNTLGKIIGRIFKAIIILVGIKLVMYAVGCVIHGGASNLMEARAQEAELLAKSARNKADKFKA